MKALDRRFVKAAQFLLTVPERVLPAGQLDVRVIYGYVTIMLVDQECLDYEVTT